MMFALNAALTINDGKQPLSSDIAGKNGTVYRHVADTGENQSTPHFSPKTGDGP